MTEKRIAIVGGGAAGYFAAIACAEANPNARVTLFEASARPLAKVRISGGGRCNVTCSCFEPAELVNGYPRGGRELRGPFSRFQAKDTVEWFESRGVALKTEPDGRIFPTTDRSETITRCLEEAAGRAGVIVRVPSKVGSIRVESGRGSQFVIESGEAKEGPLDAVLLATGSARHGFALAQALGHSIVTPVPSLFTFNVQDARLRGLAGISVDDAEVELHCADGTRLVQRGPVLVTHWGLSGPAVLKLSAWGARYLHDSKYRGSLRINWTPDFVLHDMLGLLVDHKTSNARRTIHASYPVKLPQRLWSRLAAHSGIDDIATWAHATNEQLSRLASELTGGMYRIEGKGAFKEEFVTCGGVALREVDFRTMESKVCPGLYFAGEILDIDGITGGYNFQAAWTTGWIAGQSMATR